MRLIQHRYVFPQDTQCNGILFGGKMLSWIDEDATITIDLFLRSRVAKRAPRLVTAGMERVCFLSPAHLGDLLCFEYRIVHVGTSSLTVLAIVSKNKIPVFRAYVTQIVADNVDFFMHNVKESFEKDSEWDFVEKLHKARIADEIVQKI